MCAKRLKLYNTLTRKKEVFEPLNSNFVGLYVCGPTVYNDVHLGNCRTFLTFDVLYRYLKHLGYNVKYVRNITDVGHLTNDDEGEDKIARKAHLEQVQPMQIVQRYTNRFHKIMDILNICTPDIEPTATGHISEQIALIEKIIDQNLAYQAKGSVYFDMQAYFKKHPYGELSGTIIEELIAKSRSDLNESEAKRHPADFALWKKAPDNHIMAWNSPWSVGFPGWHLECSAMSTKYLGQTFDIHGGGMDLQFPHHECEIAQSKAATNQAPVRYWLHSNMLTLNKQKMSKSDGNTILPQELFEGSSPLISQPYSPMTLRFAMLQTHYRSTMDISEAALKAARKGYIKLINGLLNLERLNYPRDIESNIDPNLSRSLENNIQQIYNSLNDDLNTAKCIAQLFNLLRKINNFYNKQDTLTQISPELFQLIKEEYYKVTQEILGLKIEEKQDFEGLIEGFLDLYRAAKIAKDYDTVDKIRAILKKEGIILRDSTAKTDWTYA